MAGGGVDIIVPMAGPDFVSADGELKALKDIGGSEPFLLATLLQRPWAKLAAPSDYTFVLHDREETRAFAQNQLQSWFPGCRTTFVSHFTAGAALSSLAGAAVQLGSDNRPLLIDLADILYTTELDPSRHFDQNPDDGGIALTFASSNPMYSYLRRDERGDVIEAAEKKVISGEASAGTYAFKSGSVFLRAIAHALENAPTQTYRDLFFVCPLFNGVIAQSLNVAVHGVTNVRDVKS
ncbi:hypothetical protein DSM25559_1981 [Agrobacterium rosae]|uniref:Uncharacterized protein n=2 Tax=Agrobacterium rosae TaxID=1972867 RepID=A0A1R3TNI4_9HYPH|nr:hypothetical protein DSM25559_1981 [Agrobacterium rosae]